MTTRCHTLFAALCLAALALPVAQGQVEIVPAFSVDVRVLAGEVFAGQNATYEITIGNTALFPRNAHMSMVSALPPDWTYSFSVDPVPVGAQNGTNVTLLAIQIPATAQPGTLQVTIEAKDGWNFTRLDIPVTVKPTPADESQPLAPPRLTLSISTGDSAQSGDTASGTLLIQNHDTNRPTVTVQISPISREGWRPFVRDADRTRVLTQPGTPGSIATIPIFVDVPPLARNTTKELDITVSTEGITYSAKWSVLGVLPEASESAPTEPTPADTTGTGTSGTVTGTPTGPRGTAPNLEVFVEPVEVPITSGDDTTANVRLVNTGGTVLSVRLEDTPPFSWRSFTFEPSAPVSLAPGETAIVTMTIAAPAGIPPGGLPTEAAVTAIADGLIRPARFVIKVIDQLPRDETTTSLIEAPATPEGGVPLPSSTIFVAVGLAAVGAGAIAIINRPFREKLLWGAAGLYTRLARPDVLGHEDRERLYKLVETQPGIHFHALQRDLGWNTGTLTYHVRVLERHGFVVSRRDGLYRRFYLSGAAPRKEIFENQGPTGLRADVMEAVRNTPGISQSDLALGLGANKQTVNYHVKALERAGTIRVEKRGRDTFLYAADTPTPPGPGHAQA